LVRKETIGACDLYLGDCREILPTLGNVDAVVTDPPYGVGYFRHDGPGRGVAGAANFVGVRIEGDDAPFEPEHFLAYPHVVMWGSNHYAARLPEAEGRWLVWDKRCGVTPSRDQSDCEFAWSSSAGPSRVFRHVWDGMIRDSERGITRLHPTQKPIALMRWCVEQLPPDAGTILDPFMGSGTTGIACVKLGRRFIGIEIDCGYFDIACRRIEAAYAQPDLFVESPVSKPEQHSLGFDHEQIAEAS
jgi:site-specific DNA-methyltransferase (adenine-specific)